MIIKFWSVELEEIFETWKSKNYSGDIVKSYIKKVILIQELENENDLRAYKSLHFEKLKLSTNQHSLRLNDKYRLIIEIQKNWSVKIIFIKEISKHYE